MKRMLYFFLCLMLLTGCESPTQQEHTGTQESATRIIMTFPTTEGTDLTGLPEVVEALNAITVPQIGVEVELMVVDASKTSQEYQNSITLGKQIDLMVLNGENIVDYISQKMLLPMEDVLAKYGQGIQGDSREFTLMTEGTVLNGSVYGLRISGDVMGYCGALWINPALLEQVGFPYDPERIYSFQELDDLFARLKQAYPQSYPLGQITNAYSFSTSSFFLGVVADTLNGIDPVALDIDGGSTTLLVRYEMDSYRNWLDYMRKWYLADYIYHDSAITTATPIGLYRAGVVLSIPMIGSPYFLNEESIGAPVVPLKLSTVRIERNGNTGVFWTIPVTSQNPEAAMKFLNLMYTDERVVNLLSWGVRGRDYELDEENVVHSLETRQFSNPLGLFGDQHLRYETYGLEVRKALEEYMAKAVPVNFQYSGFVFDTTGLVQEMLEIERVEKQYLKLLESGCVDLDTAYPEFIQKLYDAGIQRVISEKQCQFDAWLAENLPEE